MSTWQDAIIVDRSAPGHAVVEVAGQRYLLEHDPSIDERLHRGQTLDVVVEDELVVQWRPQREGE